ncbi:MAG: hypothetical protein IPL79_00320 [Myxococcales bacterium]|nr:hypothetical protein [Myxococcales bacterium]
MRPVYFWLLVAMLACISAVAFQLTNDERNWRLGSAMTTATVTSVAKVDSYKRSHTYRINVGWKLGGRPHALEIETNRDKSHPVSVGDQLRLLVDREEPSNAVLLDDWQEDYYAGIVMGLLAGMAAGMCLFFKFSHRHRARLKLYYQGFSAATSLHTTLFGTVAAAAFVDLIDDLVFDYALPRYLLLIVFLPLLIKTYKTWRKLRDELGQRK